MTKKKTSAPSAAPKRARLAVSIDYPREGDPVRPGHYAVRLSVSAPSVVQVRFDGGDWLDCREAVGFRWRDWEPRPGKSLIEARARRGTGRWAAAPARAVVVAR